ncbi:MAG: DUF1475 family protein [Acidimicrobiia bacterium]
MEWSESDVGTELVVVTVIRSLALVSLGVMAGAIAMAMSTGSISNEGSAIWALPWGRVTLIDLYIGLAFFGAWVAFRERSIIRTIAWWVSLLLLGNLAAAVYLVVASFGSANSRELIAGNRA